MDRVMKLLIVLFLLIFAGSTAMAQADMGFKGIGGKLGLVDPSDIGSTIGFGAFVNFGTFAPKFHLEANIDYWSKTENVTGGEFSVRDLTFGGTVKYVHEPEGQKFKPFALGGLHLHLLKGEAKSDAVGGFPAQSSSSSDTKIGIDLGGGSYFAVSPKVDLLAEIRYRIVSDINQLVLNAGVLFHLGQ